MLEELEKSRLFGGTQRVCKHESAACACDMVFALYLPPQAAERAVPLLWYLSGLTCTHENAMAKAGLQTYAARLGLAVVYPDTSPRGEGVADDAAFDLGQGAGFYVNARQDPWRPHYQMSDYILTDLTELLARKFANQIDMRRQGICGHSMGGHGALTLALNNPKRFASLSAFAPICNPVGSDWGRKQLTAYLGADESAWVCHDASLLMEAQGWKSDVLIDQGSEDQFGDLLKPETLVHAMALRRQAGIFRMQQGYDHSYFFVASFAEDHVRFHAERLCAA